MTLDVLKISVKMDFTSATGMTYAMAVLVFAQKDLIVQSLVSQNGLNAMLPMEKVITADLKVISTINATGATMVVKILTGINATGTNSAQKIILSSTVLMTTLNASKTTRSKTATMETRQTEHTMIAIGITLVVKT